MDPNTVWEGHRLPKKALGSIGSKKGRASFQACNNQCQAAIRKSCKFDPNNQTSDHYTRCCSLRSIAKGVPTNQASLLLLLHFWIIRITGIISNKTKRQRAKKKEALCAPADGGNIRKHGKRNRKQRLGQCFLSALRCVLAVNSCQVDNYLENEHISASHMLHGAGIFTNNCL